MFPEWEFVRRGIGSIESLVIPEIPEIQSILPNFPSGEIHTAGKFRITSECISDKTTVFRKCSLERDMDVFDSFLFQNFTEFCIFLSIRFFFFVK